MEATVLGISAQECEFQPLQDPWLLMNSPTAPSPIRALLGLGGGTLQMSSGAPWDLRATDTVY